MNYNKLNRFFAVLLLVSYIPLLALSFIHYHTYELNSDSSSSKNNRLICISDKHTENSDDCQICNLLTSIQLNLFHKVSNNKLFQYEITSLLVEKYINSYELGNISFRGPPSLV